MDEQARPNWQDVEGRAVSLIDQGHVFQELGQSAEALASFDKAVAICRPIRDQSDAVALILAQALDNRGNELVNLGQLTEAIPCFDEAIQVHEGFVRGEGTWQDIHEIAVTVMNKGRALMFLGREDEALGCFERSREDLERCETCPDFARVWLNKGELRFRQKHFEAALEEYERAVYWWEELPSNALKASKPDFAYTLLCKAESLLRLGRPIDALEAADRSIALQRAVLNHTKGLRAREATAEALEMRGNILNALGRTTEAQESFRESARLKGGEAAMNESRVASNAQMHLDLKRAIFQAVMMWSNPHYERFLRRKKPGRLAAGEHVFDWFDWFLGDWGVKRTITKRKRNNVRKYLDTEFRRQLAGNDKGMAVDNAAKHIKGIGGSSNKSKNGNGPRSLVSKIGFFLKPNTLVPYDRFSRKGLKKIRPEPREDSPCRIKTYSCYLKAFDTEFGFEKDRICTALSEPWVKALAKRFRCPISDLKSLSLQRKVFDNYLMEIGKRKTGKTQSRQSSPEHLPRFRVGAEH